MKSILKCFGLVALLALGANAWAAAATVEVAGEEILGIIRYTNGVKGRSASAVKEYAVGVPWLGREADGTVRTGETVDKLIIKDGLRAGDELGVWMPDQGTAVNGINQGTKNFSNATGSYAVYRWNGTKWEGVRDADTGLTAPDATTTVVSRGAAVWYKRTAGGDNDFLLAGLVSNKCISVVAPGTTAKPTLSLMTNPFPNDAVDAVRFTGCQDGDQLVLLNESGDNATYNYKGGWGNYITTTVRGHASTKWQAATSLVIPAGKSFWYVSRSATVPQIDWKSAKVAAASK